MSNAIWYFRQFCMLSFLDGAEHLIELVKANKYPDKNEILIDKIFFYDTMFIDILMTRPDRLYNSRVNALKLLDMMSSTITSDDQFVLGTTDYTLADIMATAFLTRLNIQTQWFEDQMKERPNVARYWKKIQARPSYKEG